MPIIVKSLGIIIACFTAIMIFSPPTMRNIAAFVKQGKNIYIMAAMRIILGIFFIVASFYCTISGIVLAIGILTLATGVVAMFIGLPKMLSFVDWWLAKTDNFIRIMTSIAFILGALLIYSA